MRQSNLPASYRGPSSASIPCPSRSASEARLSGNERRLEEKRNGRVFRTQGKRNTRGIFHLLCATQFLQSSRRDNALGNVCGLSRTMYVSMFCTRKQAGQRRELRMMQHFKSPKPRNTRNAPIGGKHSLILACRVIVVVRTRVALQFHATSTIVELCTRVARAIGFR